MEFKIKNNTTEMRYELSVEGATAFIAYQMKSGKIYLTHTEVPEQLKGKGIGSALLKNVLSMIAKEHLEMVPLCSFVAAYIERHPEWKKLLKNN